MVVIATTDGSTAVITDTKSGKAELVAVEGDMDIGAIEVFGVVLEVGREVVGDVGVGILFEAGVTTSMKPQLATASINVSIAMKRRTKLVFDFIAIIRTSCLYYLGLLLNSGTSSKTVKISCHLYKPESPVFLL